MSAKYNNKLLEVGEKFKSFFTDVSHDIAHGTFYQELQIQYNVNIGAVDVDLNDLLGWIRGMALPPQSNVQSSGILSSVIHQSDQKSLVFENDNETIENNQDNDLASFLSRDNYASSSSIGSIQVKKYFWKLFYFTSD